MNSQRSFVRGALEVVWTVALFIGGGLAWADWISGAGAPHAADPAPALYSPGVEDQHPAPRVWLVDGYNVLAVGLLAGREREGWWSERYRDELLERVASFDQHDAEIWVAFDGARPAHSPDAGRIHSVFAPSADEWLLARIRDHDPERTTLVTADRRLTDRARHRGVAVVAPAAFLARCPAVT